MKYRKKPIVIDAVQWTGESAIAMSEFLGDKYFNHGGILKIHTLEGVMEAQIGDWIIKGIKGEFYPCKPDIFEATYEAVPA